MTPDSVPAPGEPAIQFGGTRDGVCVLGPDWRFRYANRSLLEILDLMGGAGDVATLWDALPPGWRETSPGESLRIAMEARAPVCFRVDPEQGGGHAWEVEAIPTREGGVRLRVHNVTGQVRVEAAERRARAAEARVADREARLEALVEGVPIAMLLLDGETCRVVEANAAAAELCGVAGAEELLGRAPDDFLPGFRAGAAPGVLRTVRETGRELQTPEVEYAGLPGGPGWFRVTVKPLGGPPPAPLLLVLAVDVTDVVGARRTQEAERRTLYDVLDTLPVGVLVAEAPSGRALYLNPAAVALAGRSRETLAVGGVGEYTDRWQTYRPSGEPYPPDDLPVARALRGETVRDEELLLRLPGGGERTVLVSAVPLIGPEGVVERALTSFYDVTDRLRLERALVERTTDAEHAAADASLRAEESRALREMGRALVSSLDPDRVTGLAVQSAMELLGARGGFVSTPRREGEQLRFSPALGIMAPLDGTEIPAGETAVDRVLREERSIRFNGIDEFPRGSPLLASIRRLGVRNALLVPMRAFGEPLGVLAVLDRSGGFGEEDERLLEAFADSAALAVHNARRYEEERTRAEVNRALLRAAEALTSTLDAGEVMERIARVAADLTSAEGAAVSVYADPGRTRITVAVGVGLLEPLAGIGGPAKGTLTEEVLRGGEPAVFSASGSTHPGLAALARMGVEHYAVIPLASGDEVLGILGVVRSTRGEAFTEEELRVLTLLSDQATLAVRNARLYEAAESASRAKSEFLAMMSHELRTPLNALEGYASLLEDGLYGPLTDEQRTTLGRMRVARHHLIALIEQVLDVARVEAGTRRVAAEAVDVAEVAASVAESLRGVADGKGLVLAVDAEPAPVRSDAMMVRQIVTNVLGNALKFTDEGGVEVRVRAEPGGARVEVEDTGAGIPAEEQERIFEPFYQVDRSTTRKEGGTGLGLALSREYARMLGGDLTVRSAPGEGSTFVLRLARDADVPR